MHLGDIRLGETLDFKFSTRSFATGAPTTLAGIPVISAYVGDSITQITAGITLTVDFDGVTGLHNIRVVAISANGYAAASNYDLVITTGTVGGVSVVGEVVGSFSVEARSALMPTTAARTLDVSATGEAGLDWANIGNPATAQNLSATNIDVDQIVASVSGAVGSVTGLTAANLDAAVSSRMASYTQPAGFLAATFPSTVASPTNITAGTITTATNLTTNNDKTGYGLSAAAVQAIWDALTSALTTAGSIGKKLADWVIGTAQTGDAFARLGAPAGASISADIAVVDANVDAILMDTAVDGVRVAPVHRAACAEGIAQGGTISQITLASDAPSINDIYLGQKISIYGGTGANQTRGVKSYNGTSKVVLVARNWTVAPDTTSLYRIEYDFGPKVNNALEVFVNDNGADLTTLGDARIANLDATISSRATPAQILTTALTESYAADGAAPTLAQVLFLIQQSIGDFSIVGTTLTVKKQDGTTTAATYTLDSATDPTSRTRAT